MGHHCLFLFFLSLIETWAVGKNFFPTGLALTQVEEWRLESTKGRPKILIATVYLKSQSGRSFLGDGKAVPIDPTPYLPSSETIKRAINELQRLGFKIEAQGVTLSISGPPELFEQTCGVKIWAEERIVHEPGKTKTIKQPFYRSSQPEMHIKEMSDIIEGIVISILGVPFGDYEFQE